MNRKKRLYFVVVLASTLVGLWVFEPFGSSRTRIADNEPSVDVPLPDGDKNRLFAERGKTVSVSIASPASPPYILSCDTDTDTEIGQDEIDTFYEEYDRYIIDLGAFKGALENSKELDSRLVYAMLVSESDPAKSVQLLTELIAINPQNELANWDLLNICTQNFEMKSSGCNQKIMTQVIDSNQQNAPTWLAVMELRHKQNDRAGVIEALQQATTAPNYNEFYSDHLALFQRTLLKSNMFEKSNILEKSMRMLTSMMYLASNSLPSFNALIEFCKDSKKEKAYVAHNCLEAGKRMSHSAETILTNRMGYGLQKISYKNLNDRESLKKLEKKLSEESFNQTSLWKKANSLLTFDSDLRDVWFQNLLDYGEMKSYEMLIDDAIERSKNNDYNPCPSLSAE